MQQQQRRHPASMLATATHDHKRGEDVRARLNALSELPLEWRRQVGRWARLNRLKRREVDGQRIPGRNDEYLLYQTLVGAWPLEIDTPEHPGLAEFTERIVAYMIKASREAKVRTSWTAPDQEYEAGLERFVRRILDPQEGRAFLADLLAFQPRIALDRGGQRPRPDAPEAHRPRRARHLSGLRALGPQPGGSGQPPPGRLRAAAHFSRASRRSGRAARRLARRADQAARGGPHARAAAAPSGAVRDGLLRAARGRGRACRSRGRVRPPHRTGNGHRRGAAPGRRAPRGSGAAVPRRRRLGATRASSCPRHSPAESW